ncbi:RNA helicase Mov10l1-like [Acipenser oxyrinchus oxyrinchus]|uniref:RNA helicase n=1 Tax=Acipenser oxyrinchus oxyrinchus TaxID=40147 RepID=A0AAD8DBN5_ACIOX|nr:RNA helicase Mov10l1-like [Acipenser oxyrinchus oxyrinchus]
MILEYLLSKFVEPLWRRADEEEEEERGEGAGETLHIRAGTVTRFCQDYGLIDDLICFTAEVVLGGAPLSAGHTVSAIAVRDREAGVMLCIQVQRLVDAWEEDGGVSIDSESNQLKPLIGTVTSCDSDGGFITQTTYFPRSAVCEGFEPVKGDWVQAQYFISPTQWSSQARSVAPLRYRRIDKVRVSSLYGRSGVLGDSVFFTLDSLRVPGGYCPSPGDLVNVVVVESSQSCYCWRALCMAPVHRSSVCAPEEEPPLESEHQVLLRNKGGLEVSRMTSFGSLFLGQDKDLLVWIENKGAKAQTLLSCGFAGWDRERQFKLHFPEEEEEPELLPSPPLDPVLPVQGPCSPVCPSLMAPSQSVFGVYQAFPMTFMACVQSPYVGKGMLSFYPLGGYCLYPTPLLLRPSLGFAGGGGKWGAACTAVDRSESSGVQREAGECGTAPLVAVGFNSAGVQGGEAWAGDGEWGTVSGGRAAPEAQQSRGVKEPVSLGSREIEIKPGEKIAITIRCEAKNLGRCRELLLLHFTSFSIGRLLVVRVQSEEESLILSSSPYVPANQLPAQSTRPQAKEGITVLPARLPPRFSKRHLPNFLGQYPIPQKLRECFELKNDVLVAEPELAEPLSRSVFRSRFSALLWLEELHAESETKEFSLSGAFLRRSASYLQLEVPGVSEGRPSASIGDKVILRKPIENSVGVEYVAYITEINDEELSLRVNCEFHHNYLGEPLDVEFTYNRLTMRRCHAALDQAEHLRDTVLFPERVVVQTPQLSLAWEEESEGDSQGAKVMSQNDGQTTETLCVDMMSVATQTRLGGSPHESGPGERGDQFFNPSLNPHQRDAVKRILAGECRPTPYILFGPPGTGKTVTLIEAILQIHHKLCDSRVLVCTPSNSAADLLCTRLHQSGHLHSGNLVRVNAICRSEESIPEMLKPYSRAGEDVRQAAYHRVVISTCSSAGMFYQLRIRIGHFTHVFIDEAGQASEPESLIPLALVSEDDGQIVLAGDPMQLGPVVKSKLASAFGLGRSLLERLMSLPLYSRDEKSYGPHGAYNPLLVTKLVRNYRSHESLLELPSRLFYQRELEVGATQEVVCALQDWNRLPKKGFPLLFHGVRGSEMREGCNPSWFNPVEAVQVMMYCCQLAKRLYNPISPSDIGIITPYRKQVEKIRVLLQRVGLMDIKVGSVEEFQGQEFLVILISTVRSNEDRLDEDVQHVLGFLSNPKRFNVAVTRPKALLIVVGNPHVLIKDPCFGALLEYSTLNGAFLGCDIPPELAARSKCGSTKRNQNPTPAPSHSTVSHERPSS